MPRRPIRCMSAVILSVACWMLLLAPAAFAADRYALEFDGVDDYVEVPTEDYIFEDGDTFTIETWARWFDDTRSLCSYRYSFQRSRFRTRGSAALTVLTGITNDQWHHVAVVLPSGGASSLSDILFYIDGALQTETVVVSNLAVNTAAAGDVTIGALEIAPGQTAAFFKGLLDDVRIYDKAMGSHDILEMME